jgi:uncharacterized SAM-binding protein YcdF (DUF218 family)
VFFASKVLALITQPLAWVLALLAMGWFLQQRKPKAASRLIGYATVVLMTLGWQPLPDLLIRHLESQYTEIPAQADLSNYVGVVVLGGALESGDIQQGHSQAQLNSSAERMTAPVAMLRTNPHLRVIFTGGEASLFTKGLLEADRAHLFFENMGLRTTQVEYESESRTTYENAEFTAKLPNTDIRQRWLLVTSAWHMPRSMATFVKAGWNVTAYPVDFHTGVSTPWMEYSMVQGVSRWQLVLHELLGLLAYRLTGRL